MISQPFADSLVRLIACGLDLRDRGPSTLTDPESILADLRAVLASENPEELSALYQAAAGIRDAECGRRMVVRGLVEFSSRCGNDCRYCGLNRENPRAERYALESAEIVESARLVASAGLGTIVLQSGEDGFGASRLAGVIEEIKERYGLAITMSVGERDRADYALWRTAGADRYLLRIESSDPALYASLHGSRVLSSRLRCLDDLRDLGYQVGSGVMVGPPGQTVEHLARDVLFFASRDFDMIGIGPFIPHPDTPFASAPRGSVELTLKAVALTRVVNRNAWIPATTALGSLDRDYRVDALRAGANVLMPNYTPASVKAKYAIYPGKRCVSEGTGACAGCVDAIARAAGLAVDLSRADSLKPAFAR
jgi:biotin synthase